VPGGIALREGRETVGRKGNGQPLVEALQLTELLRSQIRSGELNSERLKEEAKSKDLGHLSVGEVRDNDAPVWAVVNKPVCLQ
jgi:hypothetical protein